VLFEEKNVVDTETGNGNGVLLHLIVTAYCAILPSAQPPFIAPTILILRNIVPRPRPLCYLIYLLQ